MNNSATYEKPFITTAAMNAATVEAVWEIERGCFADPWSFESFNSELSNPLALYFVALIDGTVAGFAGMHCVAGCGYITNIAVAPAYRGKGAAKALIARLFDCAREQDFEMLTLEVRPSNLTAISLYEKSGFVREGCRKGYYLHPKEDALIMTARLAQPDNQPGYPL